MFCGKYIFKMFLTLLYSKQEGAGERSNMESTIYSKLRENIDQYSIGMSATASGIELQILETLFTEKEAAVYMGMSNRLESAQTIAKRLEMETEYVAAVLASMTEKGLTFPKTLNGNKYYAAAPFMHGFFEHQAYKANNNRELVQQMEDYILGDFRPKYSGMRTVPLHVELNPELPVLPYDDVKNIILSKDKIGLIPCACADHAKILGRQSEKPRDVCIVFGFYAEYIIEEMKSGRWISQTEALRILEETEQAGLVHQTGGNFHSTECICNCAIDYCSGLRKIKALKRPARAVVSNYFAELDEDLCSSCEICLDRCPMEAISNQQETMAVDRQRCIGCGLCTSACPMEAISLKVKPEGAQPPPETYLFMRSTEDLEKELAEQVK